MPTLIPHKPIQNQLPISHPHPQNMDQNHTTAAGDDIDSCCSTPYASAPSSPGRAGYYYSAPSSPTHFVISTTPHPSAAAVSNANSSSFEFDFPSTFPPTGASADELFCNGQIRPMKLSTHLRRPQSLAPLIESDDAVAEEDHQTPPRGREPKLRDGSLRRRTRSMSPLRAASASSFQRLQGDGLERGKGSDETTPSASSAGRSSGRWVFLKEFLYRSKSEGRRSEGHNGNFWGSLSFSPVIKDNKKKAQSSNCSGSEGKRSAVNNNNNGNGKRRGPSTASAHELHYTANRAQTEEMRKKTFLPYRQGLLGCLGFNSKSYDAAMNGFARALSSR